MADAWTSRNPLVREFPALASRDFSLLFGNSMFSAAANWALLLARGWLVFDLTKSSTAVGVVTFAGMAPFIFASPISGVLADRMDRRSLSLWSGLIAFLGTVGLAIVTLGGLVEVWHVVVFALLGGIARAVQTPAQQAMIPALVEKEQLLSGMALSGVSVHGSRLAGPLVGGVLLEVWGAGSVFVLSAALYFGGAVCLWAMRYRNSAPPGTGRLSVAHLLREMGEGARYIEQDRRVALVIGLVVFHCALTMAFDSLIPELSHDLGGGGRLYSALLMGLGAGAITGTIGIAKIPTLTRQGNALAVCGAVSGLSMLVLGLATSPWVAVAGAVVAGGAQASYMALSATFVQDMTPDSLRGRVMSLYVMLAAGHMAFVNLGMGALADVVGVRILLVVPGLLWTAVFLAGAFALGDLRELLRSGTFRTAAPSLPVPAQA